MDDVLIWSGVPEKKEVLPVVLESALTEDLLNIQSPEKRWKKTMNTLFSSLVKIVSRFFITKVKSNEAVEIQSLIRNFFRKTDQIQEIRNNSKLQNVFLMGYCHAIDKMMDSFEDADSYRQNNPIKEMIDADPQINRILLSLDKHVQMSHRELAGQLDLKESELSDLMRKLEKAKICQSLSKNENQHYSLAYPNGAEAVKIVKENDRPSADTYTDLLLSILGLLQDIYLRNNVETGESLRKCLEMMERYTTKPATCERRMRDLVGIFQSVRFNSSILIVYEREIVKKNVTIFTKNIKSEEVFRDSVIKNLNKNVKYQYFVEVSDQFNTEDKIAEYFHDQFMHSHQKYEISILNNACFCVIQKDEMRELLGNDVSDAVIFDWEIGFSCKDEIISAETPYIQMKNDKINIFHQYAQNKAHVS